MAGTKRVRGNPLPLIIEQHPEHYEGYPFITLLQYCEEDLLVIVDNANDKTITAYVLDYCAASNVDEELVIKVATDWYFVSNRSHPLSIEFSRQGLAHAVSAIYKSFSVPFVSRAIGTIPKFEMNEIVSIKRRRKKTISPTLKPKNQ